MNMSKKLKRRLALLTAFFITLSAHIAHEPRLEYEILDNCPAFASYSGGKVYIGKSRSDCPELEEGDVFVLDCRDGNNPDMKICNSYKVCCPKQRHEIVEILCCYEEMFPSDWDRDYESMCLEWTLHNYSYTFGYDLKSSTDADLDNNEKDKYQNKVLYKLLK